MAARIITPQKLEEKKEFRVKFRANFHCQNKFAGNEIEIIYSPVLRIPIIRLLGE